MIRSALLLGFALAAGALAAPAGAGDRDGIEGPVAATVLKVRDGDTVEVEAHVWPLQSVRVAVRLRGIDAPELKARCAVERSAAELARDRLAELVGAEVRLTRVSGDKYFGRVLADLATPSEPDIGRRLLREGLVDVYDGGRRRDWCAAALGFNRLGDEPTKGG